MYVFFWYLRSTEVYVFFGLLKVNGGVRILLVYLRSTEVYVFFWFT